MKRRQLPRLPEYAGPGRAVIEPARTRAQGIDLPSRVVLCFLGSVLRKLSRREDVTVVHRLNSEMGRLPIYTLGKGRNRVAIFNPGLGAPMAAAAMEELIALGARRIIACGGSGVLCSDLQPGCVIIPTAAIRDEGTSHHYLPYSRCVSPDPKAVNAIKQACEKHGTPYVTGLTWTTDAFYRETPQKVRSRQREGCLTVEMEAAAFFAVAKFRGVSFAQVLYAGDDVGGKDWDPRNWPGRQSAREKLLVLALNAVRIMK